MGLFRRCWFDRSFLEPPEQAEVGKRSFHTVATQPASGNFRTAVRPRNNEPDEARADDHRSDLGRPGAVH